MNNNILDTAEFERAYNEGDAEAIRAFWKRAAHVLDTSKQEIVDSLLDDIFEGRNVTPYIETLPDDFDDMCRQSDRHALA